MILVAVAGDVVDGHPLLVLDPTEGLGGLVGHAVQVVPAVAGDPGAAQVVAVGDPDCPIRVQVIGPPGIERQGHLVGATLGVEVDVGVGVVHPAGRHGLGAGGDTLIALNNVVPGRGGPGDGVGPEVEVIEGAEL